MTQYPPDDRGATGQGLPIDDTVEVVDTTEAGWPPPRSAPGESLDAAYATVPETSYVDDAPPVADPVDPGPSGTADVAKDEAAQVKDTALDAGSEVAATAKDEAQNVVGEAKDQALSLLDQAKSEAGSQASTQQQRIAGLLDGYAQELQAMTSGQESSGPLTDLARQGAEKAGEFTSWLQNHEPAELLDEIGAFARRRPVAFLVGAALAGVVVGRATRGFAANAKAEKLPASPATPVRAELPVTSRSMVEELPTEVGAYGTGPAADPVTPGTTYEAGPGYGAPATYGSADPAISPVFDDPRVGDVARDDVVRDDVVR